MLKILKNEMNCVQNLQVIIIFKPNLTYYNLHYKHHYKKRSKFHTFI